MGQNSCASITVYTACLHLTPHSCCPATAIGLPPPTVRWKGTGSPTRGLMHATAAHHLTPKQFCADMSPLLSSQSRPHKSGKGPLCDASYAPLAHLACAPCYAPRIQTTPSLPLSYKSNDRDPHTHTPHPPTPQNKHLTNPTPPSPPCA